MTNKASNQSELAFTLFEREERIKTRDLPHVIETPTRECLPLPVTGLILCGGESKRMGRPKAFLPYEGSTIIEHLIGIFKHMFDEVFLVANKPEEFSRLGVDVIQDILPNRGPICGILSGLLVSGHQHVFVAACDMPLLDKRLMRALCTSRNNADVVVLSHQGNIEPLFGSYSKACVKSLEESLFAGGLTMQNVLSGLNALTFECPAEYAGAGDQRLPCFFNVNTPGDYSRLLNCL